MKKNRISKQSHIDKKVMFDSEVWLKAWCSVANAYNCETVAAATKWADELLVEYKKRFEIKKSNVETSGFPKIKTAI